MDVGGVKNCQHILLHILVPRPGVHVQDAASNNVPVEVDLKAHGLHGWLIQVLLQGGQQLKGVNTGLLNAVMVVTSWASISHLGFQGIVWSWGSTGPAQSPYSHLQVCLVVGNFTVFVSRIMYF